jgi:putative ABC transport system permease protein
MEGLLRDLGYAARGLRRNLGFSLVATVTIALGIAACTAIFSVVNAVLLRPLPYSDPQRLVIVWGELRARHVKDWPFSPPDFRDLQLQTTGTFEGVAALTPGGRVPFTPEGGEPEQIRVAGATPNLFRVLGARVVAGRDFIDDDALPQPAPPPVPQGAAQPGAPPPPGPPPARLPQMVILSHGLWQRSFGGDPAVVGRNINLGGGRAQVVGILAPDFELLFPTRANVERVPDAWTAMRIDYAAASRNNVSLRVVARMRPGVSVDQASAEVERLSAELRKQFPIKETSGLHFRAVSMFEDIVGGVRPAILALMGAVVFVLLIACANVANLLIVRASARGRELAVRAAIGAGRGQLVRQMLAESLVIAALGSALGLLLAQQGIKALIALGPRDLPRLQDISMDPLVLAFAVCAGLLTALACGLVPALRASRQDVVDALRSSGGRSGGLRGGRRLRSTVVVAEVALSFMLLIGAGLMLRSVLALGRVDPGYDPNQVLTFFARGGPAPQPAQRAAFVKQVRERLLAIPGVVGAAASTSVPLDGGLGNCRWGTEAAVSDPTKFRQADVKFVAPGYFETLKTRLIAGRTFTDADNDRYGPDAPRQLVIDDKLAALAFPNQPAIGKRLLVRLVQNPEPEWWEVIGVVAHQRHVSLADDGPEALFATDGYGGPGAVARWAVRTTGDPASYAPAVRAAIKGVDRRTLISEVQPMTALVNKAMAPIRFTTTLIGIFAALALVLAAIGLYGVLSTIVRQRTSEIGMRMVFGAQRSTILGLVLGEGLKLGLGGIVLGLAGALATTRVMSSLVVGVETTDPLTFAAIVGVFAVVALAASWIPGHRASRLDPMEAIREE